MKGEKVSSCRYLLSISALASSLRSRISSPREHRCSTTSSTVRRPSALAGRPVGTFPPAAGFPPMPVPPSPRPTGELRRGPGLPAFGAERVASSFLRSWSSSAARRALCASSTSVVELKSFGLPRVRSTDRALSDGWKVHCCCSHADSRRTDSSRHFCRSSLPNMPSSYSSSWYVFSGSAAAGLPTVKSVGTSRTPTFMLSERTSDCLRDSISASSSVLRA
mmetsp:Transcript_16574/g.52705  ORF Transcript_16574/g.52705 Transcript_16574/m.52705 type:complete len:221 (+) Transcript_16574:655-1317(+)